MFKEYILKKMLESKMKDIPAEQRDKILAIAEKNPELLMSMAKEAEEKVKQGKSQTDAMMEVAKAHEDELKKLLA